MSNYIRGFRITNEPRLFKKFVSHLQIEMRKANFTEKDIHQITNKSAQKVSQFCPETLRPIKDESPNQIFPPATVFSPGSATDGILINIVMKAYEISGKRSFTHTPSRKVRNTVEKIIFTKKFHKYFMKKLANKGI